MTKTYDMTVKELALISGVTIRALHHYDEIGLLIAKRTEAGYRVYGREDALRLQQILLHKSFGLSLDDIRKALDDPGFSTLESLRVQKASLQKQAETMDAMIAAVDAAIHSLSGSQDIDLKAIFDGFDPGLYAEEVEENWGETDSYIASQRRVKNYTETDWKQLKSQEEAIWRDAASLMKAGATPYSPQAEQLAQRHRDYIDRWFYETTPEGYVALADLWESDPRFAANIDKFGNGLTGWVVAAVRAKYGVVV